MRHAEPAGFCGRGRRDRRVATRLSCLIVRAHCMQITQHQRRTSVCPANRTGFLPQGRDSGRRVRTEPIRAMTVRWIGMVQSQVRHVPLARAGLMSTQRRMLDVNGNRNPQDERLVDALALAAEEGRGHAAKCPGEALAACEPGMSEWGNPPGARPGTCSSRREPGELKHLSTPRKREDSPSSGERTGRSPNPAGGRACRRCLWGVGRAGWRGRQPLRCPDHPEPKTAGTGHRRG